jgi:hypothetical protein
VAAQHPDANYGKLDVPIEDPEILPHLDQGLHLRSEGDMRGALEELRLAYNLRPDHPKLIYQLAYTMDLMGLEGKAAPLWLSLSQLGTAAGDYFKLAQMRLEEKPPDAAILGKEEREGHLRIAEAKSEKDSTFKLGERHVLRFGIHRSTDQAVNAADTMIAIHFFDTVNGKRIARALTDAAPEPVFLTTPVDWQEPDRTEWVEIPYVRTDLTAAEIKNFGLRAYYGYVLEIYWKGKLQDQKAEPPELAEFAREMPPPTADTDRGGASGNPLFPDTRGVRATP